MTIEESKDSETVEVEPLPFQEDTPVVLSNEEYTRQLVAETPHQFIRVLLDEIDVASSIPGADGHVRRLTKKIRDKLQG